MHKNLSLGNITISSKTNSYFILYNDNITMSHHQNKSIVQIIYRQSQVGQYRCALDETRLLSSYRR